MKNEDRYMYSHYFESRIRYDWKLRHTHPRARKAIRANIKRLRKMRKNENN